MRFSTIDQTQQSHPPFNLVSKPLWFLFVLKACPCTNIRKAHKRLQTVIKMIGLYRGATLMVDKREQLCIKTLIRLQVNDERKGTSNVTIIFIVPFPFRHVYSLGWGQSPQSAWPPVASSITRTSRDRWGIRSHQGSMGLGSFPGGCAQNSRPGGSGISELLSVTHNWWLKVRTENLD